MRHQNKILAAVAAAALLVLLPLSMGMADGPPAWSGTLSLPMISYPGPEAVLPTATSTSATATSSATSTTTATATSTVTNMPTSMSTSTVTSTPTESGSTQNYMIEVGPGYTDVSAKQLVRTSGNRLYVSGSTCAEYPCTDVAQTLRMYRANSTGVPSGFTLLDAAKSPTGVGQWAIAIDGADTIHVAWNERTTSGGGLSTLRYTTFSTGSNSWGDSPETIDGALGLDVGGQGVQSLALALDASGAPHVVYLKGSGSARRVYQRARSGAGWSAATQLDDGVSYSGNQKAWHPNLAFDSAGRLLAVWQRGSFNTDNDGTLFSRVQAANGAWGVTVNVSGDNAARVTIDQSTSLLVTPGDRYHLTWISAGNDYIRYQYSDDSGQSWQSNNPGGGAQATHNPSLGYAAGKLRIYGHGTPEPAPDGHGENLYFFEGDGGAAAWGGWALFVTGANFDSSVNTRWSQFFCAFPNTIDVAYWNDIYPNVLYAGSEIKNP